MAKFRPIPYEPFEPEDSIFRKLKAKRARAYHFLIDADEAKLTTLCDQWFNQPDDRSEVFKPVAPLAMITVLNNSCATGKCDRNTWESGACPYLPEQCSRILMLDGFDEVQGLIKCNQCFVTIFVQTEEDSTIYGFTPYRFTDSGMLMIRNRELLGLPDVHASIKFPVVPEGEPAEKHFSLSTRMKLRRAFKKKVGELPGIGNAIISAAEVIPNAAEILLIDPDPEVRSTITNWKGFSAVMEGISGVVREFAAVPGREKILQSRLLNHIRPFAMMNKWVNLKQFRTPNVDEEQPGKASYQAIIEYEYQPMNIHGGGRIDGGFTVKFPAIDKAYMDSLQFASTLGVEEEISVRTAYWIDFDYELHYRNSIWGDIS